MGDRTYLIRHARPVSTWGGADDDPGLDPEGLRQAQAACQALLALTAEARPSRIVSSPLRRCRETARPLADALALPIEILADVGEIPTPRGLSSQERGPWLRTALSGRWADIHGDIDYQAWREAVRDAVLARPGAAIFSHFVAINAVVSLLEASDQVVVFRPDHTAILTLEVEAEALRLLQRGREAVTGVL